MSQRHAVTEKMAAAHKLAVKSDKTAILESPVELTGWHRDQVRHAPRRPARSSWSCRDGDFVLSGANAGLFGSMSRHH